MDLRARFRRRVPTGTRTVHVATTGSDGNPGTRARPYASINWALRRARPGDLVLVDSGTYGYTGVQDVHGAPGRWIAVMPVDEHAHVRVHVPAPTDNFFTIERSSFLAVFGLEVAGSQRNPITRVSGISIYGDSHDIVLWNNHVHDFPGGGIDCFDYQGSGDLLDISFNVVHATSRYSPQNTSGISVYASRDLTRGRTIDGHYGIRLLGNYLYDVECTVPFTPGGFDVVTDGNGISVDSLRTVHGYRKPVLVEGNLVTGCGGRAVHVFDSTGVDVLANTAVGNLRTRSPAITGGSELDGTTDRSVRIQAM